MKNTRIATDSSPAPRLCRALWLAVLATSCSPRTSERPANDAPLVETPTAVAPDALVAASSERANASEPTPSATETSPPAAAAPELESRFLPHEAACRVDADCAVTASGLATTTFCCDPCGAVAGAKTWVAKADALCTTYRRGASLHVCPPRDCSPPGTSRCQAGRCALVPN